MKLLLVFLLVVSCALAFPRPPINRRISQQRAAARLRRAPLTAARRTMLISGYYRPLLQRRQGYEPETAMTAFATGDNVAAGSYLGTAGGCPSCVEQQDNNEFIGAPEPNEEPFSGPVQDFQPADAPLSEPSADTELAPPVRKPKAPKKPQNDDDDDDDEDVYVPTKGKKGSHTYFPIVFGGAGGARSGAGAPGGVTAIANSYSSGKGGVANSHATAYGAGSGASRKRSKRPLAEDDSDDDE